MHFQLIHYNLPMEVVDTHEKYLGLPSVIGKSKKQVFSNIRDKVCHRLKGWKEKWLSKGGKEILIKSVIQAIPSYAMGCFKFPSYFTSELEGLMSNFWWESTNGRGIHWAKWKDLCTSKQFGGLGFRDLEAFNNALLAKQLWRLLENSDSLLSRVFKARHYPNSDVLGASLGSNPSYTWRSIFGAKNLLEAGIRWRVGNGKSISIWGDKWLPRESTFRVFTPRGNNTIDMKVSDLINPASQQWNVDLIKATFDEEDWKCILSVPLGRSNNLDLRVWHYNKNGIFSVRSAYHLAVQMSKEAISDNGSSSNASFSGDWKWLWALSLPSKIKIFMWRACKNLLPTRNNLLKRKLIVDTSCVLCRTVMENPIHCFASCSFARQVWALSNIPWSTYGYSGTDFFDWVQNLRSHSDKSTFETCVLLCWSIWHTRNKVLFENRNPAALEVVNFVNQYAFSLKQFSAEILSSIRRGIRGEIRWQPPGMNVVKVNFDASINSGDGVCGLGAVARTSSGDCIAWASMCIRQPLDPPSAEAKAALFAVEFARDHLWNSIILEGDSSEIIKAIIGESNIHSNFGNIISDLKSVSTSFELFRAQHVGREGNRVAHEVARLSNKNPYALNVLPDSIMNIVSAEAIS